MITHDLLIKNGFVLTGSSGQCAGYSYEEYKNNNICDLEQSVYLNLESNGKAYFEIHVGHERGFDSIRITKYFEEEEEIVNCIKYAFGNITEE